MLERVRAKRVLELIRRKGEVVDVIDDDEILDLGMLHDIAVDSPSVGLATANVEIPFLATVLDDSTYDAVAQKVQHR